MRLSRILALVLLAALRTEGTAAAQGFEQRGFIEGHVSLFPKRAPNDRNHSVGDLLVRQEAFVRGRWLELAAGVDFRANSYEQVEDDWRLDYEDRGVLRPRIALRRLSASVHAGFVTVDVGKQFIRWARTDILNPTDRFAPRDFVNVIHTEFLPVMAVRPMVQVGSELFEVVWAPQLTPSRLPMLTQRWTVTPPEAVGTPIVDLGSRFPEGSQYGLRWRHLGRVDFAFSYYDGFNHLPDVQVQIVPEKPAITVVRTFPELRTYGGDAAIPLPWFTVRAEAAFFESPSKTSEEYVLYVAEIERMVGEWIIAAGYAGEVVTETGGALAFGVERGLARSVVARVAYTIDPLQSIAVESAIRQDGNGLYAKGEYSTSLGQHWRLTLSGVLIAGSDDDFLGQFDRNSHGLATLRLSY